jgi:sulfide:quinone oxidoreductase
MGMARVVIAGGGFAALEVALALKALAAERAELTLISPNASFAYRPAATVEAFGDAPPKSYDLREIALDLSATYHRGAVQAVARKRQWLRLGSGARLDYDYLALAVGARARMAVPGAMTFRDQRDLARFKVLLEELDAGAVRRLVFAVPSPQTWALPLYELALQSALHAARRSGDVEITLVTPEKAPLEVFGENASRAVADLLNEREITFLGSSIPHSVSRDGSLELQFDAPVRADRVVAIPELHGPLITGVPASWSGFIPIDSSGRVEGLSNVFAAGDMTDFPIKQGGLAAQQADVVAQTIAADLGAPVGERPETRILRARLLHGDGALVLRTELDALGRATGSTIEHRESRSAEDLKVFGRYLTPYLSIYLSRRSAAA